MRTFLLVALFSIFFSLAPTVLAQNANCSSRGSTGASCGGARGVCQFPNCIALNTNDTVITGGNTNCASRSSENLLCTTSVGGAGVCTSSQCQSIGNNFDSCLSSGKSVAICEQAYPAALVEGYVSCMAILGDQTQCASTWNAQPVATTANVGTSCNSNVQNSCGRNLVCLTNVCVTLADWNRCNCSLSSSACRVGSGGSVTCGATSNTNQAQQNANTNTGQVVKLINPLQGGGNLESFLNSILAVVIRIGTIIVILMMVYVGYLFVAARGEPGEITKAKQALLWTVVGALILLGAQVISYGIQATVQALSVGR